jgi:tRNA pseudouridine55 synthase
LPARAVTVHEFTISDPRPAGPAGLLDVTAAVRCSSGTYVRALARDLGESLGTGGHLTMLRRTRVGPYDISQASGLDELAAGLRMIPLAEAAIAAFPVRPLTGAEADSLSHGASLSPAGAGPGPVAALAPDGTLVALVEERDGRARPLAVFVP